MKSDNRFVQVVKEKDNAVDYFRINGVFGLD